MFMDSNIVYLVAISGVAVAGLVVYCAVRLWQARKIRKQTNARESETLRSRIAPLLLVYEREIRATSRSIQAYVSLAQRGEVHGVVSSTWTFFPSDELVSLLSRVRSAHGDVYGFREVLRQAEKLRSRFKTPFAPGITIPQGGGNFAELAAALDIHATESVAALDKINERRLSPPKRKAVR